jgi:hypothetical protein
MKEESTNVAISETSFRDEHSLPIFVGVSIILAVSLVAISMAMYNSSGAAQLDLSRPGYVNVRSQANNDSGSLKAFPSSGTIDKSVIDNFKAIYDKEVLKVKSANAFGGDPLSPSSLGMDVTTDTTVVQ